MALGVSRKWPLVAAILLSLMSLHSVGGIAARAGVVYVDVPDAPATYDGVVVPLGGPAWIQVYRNSGSNTDGDILDWTFAGNGDGSADIAFRPDSTIEALGLDPGRPIGSALNWRGGDGYLVLSRCRTDKSGTSCTDSGDWAGRERYLGVRFRSAAGMTHYGWVRLVHTPASGGGYVPVMVLDYAYESAPDTPLLAGSRNALAEDLRRALRLTAGTVAASPSDIALLDHTGTPGQVDLADAVALVRALGGLA